MDYNVWEELRKLDKVDEYQEALFRDKSLQIHAHYKDEMGIPTDEEYNEVTDILTRYPALPLGQGDIYDVHGYTNQQGINIKFVQYKGNLYIFSAYKGDPVNGEAKTCHVKRLREIMRIADPYRFYKKGTGKQGDYRYRCDLDGGFEGLKFFDKHPEYHPDIPTDRVEEIKDRVLKGEKLGNFNTDLE